MTDAIFVGFAVVIGLIGLAGMVWTVWAMSSDEGDVE